MARTFLGAALCLAALGSADAFTSRAVGLRPTPMPVRSSPVVQALGSADAVALRAVGLRPAPILVRSSPAMASQVQLSDAAPASGGVEWGSIAKYTFATGLQFAMIAAALAGLDRAGFAQLPTACAVPLFAFLGLRSRVFSSLDNRRPDRKAQEGGATPTDVKRPSWTPPGIAFPIIWSTITLLRTISATMVFAANGRVLCSAPILALVSHLVCGDTWNSITNAERRLGVSFAFVFAVFGSACYAVYEFSKVKQLAAYILLPNAVWISIATVLTGAIWRINEPVQPLLPARGDGKAARLRLPFTSFSK
ncbi:TspO/MBR family-domain-containing protein [Pavlovales sp. CCMP2436]|nr:TspO/MBR family-domain-containing protein [Pavlovales sp. CCMP2436]